MHRSHLPIAEPCQERFEAMEGSGAERFCARCTTVVHDLSQMTERQARALLHARGGGSMCVRYRADRGGALKFREPPARAFAVALVGLVACTGHAESDSLQSPEDALVCEDASGYTIPCIDAVPDDGAPGTARADGKHREGDATVKVPDLHPEKDPIVVDDDEVELMGLVAYDDIEPACPLPDPEPDPDDPFMGQIIAQPPVDDGEIELVGRVVDPALDRRHERAQRRAERREQRRERRQARRDE